MTPKFHNHYSEDPKFEIEYFYKPFHKKMITAFFAILLLFNIHCTVMDIRKEIFHPIYRRVKKVCNFSVLYVSLCAFLVAIAGYYALGDTYMPVLIFLRKPLERNGLEDIF